MASTKVFSFAFHGGAGVIPKGSIDSTIYYSALSAVCTKTFEFAEQNLSNPTIGAIDVAQFGVQLLEDDSLFNAGKGAVFTAAGTHEMEASIMDGTTLRCGAASMVMHYKNPIAVARLVMEKTPHVYLAGAGAELLASQHGLDYVADNSYFSTDKRRDQLLAAKKAEGVFMDHDLLNSATKDNSSASSIPTIPIPGSAATAVAPPIAPEEVVDPSDTGTVGCVVYYKGAVAAATSTGGMTNKLPGRFSY